MLAAAPAAPAPEATPALAQEESILSTASANQVATSGGIGSGDPSVAQERQKFAKLQADMEANLQRVENTRAQEAAAFQMQGDDPAS